MQQFEQFVGVNIWTMLFAWINLVLLYLILRKFLFNPIMNMIESRQNEIDTMYKQADEYIAEAQSVKQKYEQQLLQVREEGEQYMKDVVKKAQEREDEIIREANDNARRTLERAEQQIMLEKKQAENELKDKVSDMALEIAEAVIERDIDGDEHAALIDDFISELGKKA